MFLSDDLYRRVKTIEFNIIPLQVCAYMYTHLVIDGSITASHVYLLDQMSNMPAIVNMFVLHI